MFYKSSDVELMNILLKTQERTAPIKISIGYVSEDNQVRQGILIHEAPPYIIEMLMRKGYTLDLTSAGMRVFNQGSYSKPDGGLYARTRLKLVGVVYAVAQHKVTGELEIVDIPAAKTPIANTVIPNNLGVVIQARKLLDFEKML